MINRSIDCRRRLVCVCSYLYLRVVEVDLVPFVVAAPEAVVAQDARLVGLAILADPNDVVLQEGVLAHAPGGVVREELLLNVGQGRYRNYLPVVS